MSHRFILSSCLALFAMSSCTSGHLLVRGVGYQSVRTDYAQPTSIPEDAKIAIEYFFNEQGEVQPVVYNLTSEIMMLDQTKSFVIMPDGSSLSYYDPNVYTSTNGEYSSTTSSSSFNLGAISGILGLGGPVGSLLNATTVGSSSTTGIIRQNSVSRTDQPIVNIGPKGSIAMSKAYKIRGVAKSMDINQKLLDVDYKSAPTKFSICVTYSVDNGKTVEKLVTNFYVSSNLYAQVENKKVSQAFNQIYIKKPDALAENFYIFTIPNNIKKHTTDALGEFITHSSIYDYYIHGSLVDYQ